MKTYKAESINDLRGIAKKLMTNYKNETIFAFYGKMGSGKTTFIKEICKYMGVKDNITSPTFALINEYKYKQTEKIYHFDFYRIEKQEEVYDFGYEEYFYNDQICLIEWPELIESLLPESYVKIQITEDITTARIISVEKITFSHNN